MAVPHVQLPGYRIVDLVGRGGFAVVYRAVQTAVDREVAIKVDSRMVLDERDRRRFLREVHAAGRISGHPHVVDLHDAGVLVDGRPYLVMELCTRGSLLDRLHRRGPMRPDEVCALGVKIADALAAAHSAGVLHRDIKPANILVNRYGVPGLADFGLAVLAVPGRETSATLGALTPAYAAPEAFLLATPTERADIYSLGATLYALMSGHAPRFPAVGEPSLAQIVRLHEQPLPAVAAIPDETMAVLATALATDPDQRYPTAGAFRDALSALTTAPGRVRVAAGSTDANGVEELVTTTPAAPEVAVTTQAPRNSTGSADIWQESTEVPEAVRETTEPNQPDDDAPGTTESLGFGPRRDEAITLGAVVVPDQPTGHDHSDQETVESATPAQATPRRRLGRPALIAAALAAIALAGGAILFTQYNFGNEQPDGSPPSPPSSEEASPRRPVTVASEKEFRGCRFRLVNDYWPEDGRQSARTRQMWSEDCRFGSHRWSIRVRVCFDDPESDAPVDCSAALMPTSDTPYVESSATGPIPKDSIHYVEVDGEPETFVVSAPNPAGTRPT